MTKTLPEMQKTGSRGYLFCFDGRSSNFDFPTFVYVIDTGSILFICDTHTGIDSMKKVMSMMEGRHSCEQILVINSHYDWDHVWGNGYFSSDQIIAHEKCREKLADDEIWNGMLQANNQSMDGEVKRVFPGITFRQKIDFPQAGISVFYAPGHTDDSIYVFDEVDKVLFVGDNVELPEPYLQWDNIAAYVDSLELIIRRNPDVVIGAHNGCLSLDDVRTNIAFLQKRL